MVRLLKSNKMCPSLASAWKASITAGLENYWKLLLLLLEIVFLMPVLHKGLLFPVTGKLLQTRLYATTLSVLIITGL